MTQLSDLTLEEVAARGSFWPMPSALEVSEMPAPNRTPEENAQIITKLRFRDGFIRYQRALIEWCGTRTERFDLVVKIFDYLQTSRFMSEARDIGGSPEIRLWERETGPAALREIREVGRRLYMGEDPGDRVKNAAAEAGDRSRMFEPPVVSYEVRLKQLFALAFLAQPEMFISRHDMHPQPILNAYYAALESGDYAFFNGLIRKIDTIE